MTKDQILEVIAESQGQLVNFVLSLFQAAVPGEEAFRSIRKLVLDKNGELIRQATRKVSN